MNLPVYNPCDDGIPAKVWELLRRNKAFKEKTEELSNFQENEARWKKFMSGKKEDNYFAETAWNWMHEPVRIPRGLGPKEGQSQRLGPRIEEDQVEFLEEYDEDKEQGRAPLKLDSTWPDTPRGFQKAYSDYWADYTAAICEIVPSGLYPNEDDIPPDIEIAPALPHEDHSQAALESCFSDTALYWHWTVNTNRLFAVPRVSMRDKSSRDKIIKLITEKLEEDSPPPKVQLFGTKAQWRSFLTVEHFRESDSLPRADAIEKAIEELRFGKNLNPVLRKSRYYSHIEGQADAIDNISPEDCPDQNGWIQLVYPNIFSITEIKKIALERADSPVRQ